MSEDTGFVDEYSIYRTERPSVTFAVHREVVSPVMFRNSKDDRAETQEFGGSLHAQVNPEKFISQERNYGLHILRKLSREFDSLEEFEGDEIPDSLISTEYMYNEPASLTQSINMDTLTYGVAGAKGGDYSIKSHVVQGYTYSMEPYDITNKEVRNAVYESGTMRDSDGEQSSSLYNLVPVKPENSFVSFVTIEAPTKEMVLYTLTNILNTSNYGARETRNGKNIRNEIIAVITSDHPVSFSSGELLMDHHESGDDPRESVEEYLESTTRDDLNVYSDELDFDSYPEWYSNMVELANFEDEEELFEEYQNLTQEAYEILAYDDDN